MTPHKLVKGDVIVKGKKRWLVEGKTKDGKLMLIGVSSAFTAWWDTVDDLPEHYHLEGEDGDEN